MGSFVLIRDGSVKSVAVTWGLQLPFGYDNKSIYINRLSVIPQLEPQVQNGQRHAFPSAAACPLPLQEISSL